MEEVLRQVLGVFADEFREQAQSITDGLLRVERSHDPAERKALMAEVFRHAHSIKGNAGTLGMPDVEHLAHSLESALTEARSGEAHLPSELVVAALHALDQAQRRIESQLGGNDEEDAGLRHIAQRLLELAPGGSPVLPPAAGPASVPTARPSADEPDRRGAGESIRISLPRLTSLDRNVDELREVRSALEHRASELHRLAAVLATSLHTHSDGLDLETSRWLREQLRGLSRRMTADVGELQGRLGSVEEELRALRMLPVETLLTPLQRAIFEQARQAGKSARFEMDGTQVALDRRLLNELKDPLVHLARNAVDHGIEPPEQREKAGKPAEGVIRVSVEQRGARVLMTFADDGRGVDLESVRAHAVKRGLITPERALELPADETLELLFVPGFSTAPEVTLTSGRGVGLDVVKENLQRVGGRVSLKTHPGQGTQFLLELPLTLATAQVLAFETGGLIATLPLQSVLRTEYLPASLARSRTLDVGGQVLPIHSLARLLGLRAPATAAQSAVIIARGPDRLLALRVERVQGEREVVIRPAPPELSRLRHLSAAAALGDGRLAFVLSLRALADRAANDTAPGGPGTGPTSLRILVADDSITTRTLHRQVLEAAGFQVQTAADGEEALRLLREGGADLLVSDVRMPRMDGIALTRLVRKSVSTARLPVVLVSTLDSAEDQQLASEAGASAYLPKGAYERGALLSLVRSLLPS